VRLLRIRKGTKCIFYFNTYPATFSSDEYLVATGTTRSG